MAIAVLKWTAEVAENVGGRRDTVTLECAQEPPLEDVLIKLTHMLRRLSVTRSLLILNHTEVTRSRDNGIDALSSTLQKRMTQYATFTF